MLDLLEHWKYVKEYFTLIRENPKNKPEWINKDPWELYPGEEILSKISTSPPPKPLVDDGLDDDEEESKKSPKGEGSPNEKGEEQDDSDAEEDAMFQKAQAAEEDEEEQSKEKDVEYVFVEMERSCFFFTKVHPVRRFCTWLINNWYFDNFILLCILISSFNMTLEYPNMDPDGMERSVLDWFGQIFLLIFVIEMTSKIISMGLYWGEAPYLGDPWNKMDGFLVTISVVDWLFTTIGVSAGPIIGVLKILRILRALRPLRALNKSPKLKKVVGCVVESIMKIQDTLMVCLLMILVFAILAMNLFGGALGTCNDPNGNSVAFPDCKDKDQCVDQLGINGTWVGSPQFNYDNFVNACVTLFYALQGDGWSDQMYLVMGIVGIDQPMQTDASPVFAMYWVLFITVGNFFILNLFIGVIVESFSNSSQANAISSSKMDDKAYEAALLQEEAIKVKEDTEHYANLGPIRSWCVRNTEDDTPISNIIQITIFLNVICMAVEFFNMPTTLILTLFVLNNTFSVIFLIECILKLMGHGWDRYIEPNANKLDFLIVCVSIIDTIFSNVDTGLDANFLRALRVFRILRLLKLLKRFKGLQALIATVVSSIPQVSAILMLLMLFFFVFACAGVQMFGTMGCADGDCVGLDDVHANFQTWPKAMLTMFRVLTGDNAVGIFMDTMQTAPNCDDTLECTHDCCAQAPLPIIPLFFFLFSILGPLVILNVIIAVLIQCLEGANAAAVEEGKQKEAMTTAAALALESIESHVYEDNPCPVVDDKPKTRRQTRRISRLELLGLPTDLAVKVEKAEDIELRSTLLLDVNQAEILDQVKRIRRETRRQSRMDDIHRRQSCIAAPLPSMQVFEIRNEGAGSSTTQGSEAKGSGSGAYQLDHRVDADYAVRNAQSTNPLLDYRNAAMRRARLKARMAII